MQDSTTPKIDIGNGYYTMDHSEQLGTQPIVVITVYHAAVSYIYALLSNNDRNICHTGDYIRDLFADH